jgi:D-glycerate 3-kinase
MNSAELFATLEVSTSTAEALMNRLRPDTPDDWRALAAALALRLTPQNTRTLGISGGQGAGKSTLSMLLEQAFRLRGVKVLVLSLDDFYLSKDERKILGVREHPLLATRGVPGTHDVERLTDTLAAVFQPGRHRLPRFDKGLDDRAAQPVWFDGPADIVIIEGWCVGARPQPAVQLSDPVNDLERDQDPDGRWRHYVNESLSGSYQRLFERIDQLLYLAVPDIEAVLRWRGQQELQRPPDQRMSQQAIREFVAHYQRLTEWMLLTTAEAADFVGFLDASHRLSGFRVRP